MAESLKVLFCNQHFNLEFCNTKVLSLGSSSSTIATRASDSFDERLLKEATNGGPGHTGTILNAWTSSSLRNEGTSLEVRTDPMLGPILPPLRKISHKNLVCYVHWSVVPWDSWFPGDGPGDAFHLS